MKKILCGLSVLLLSLSTKSQTPALTYTNVSGSGSITCSTPFVSFAASVSNYTSGPLTFSWSNAGTGSTTAISAPGQYTVTAYDAPRNFSLTQVFSVGINTTVPTSTLTPTLQHISCPIAAQTITATTQQGPYVHTFESSHAAGVFSVFNYTAIYAPSAPGVYTNCVTNSVNGCSTCKTFTITTSDNYPSVYVTSPQNFMLGCGSGSVVSIALTNTSTTPPNSGSLTYTMVPSYYSGAYTPGNAVTYSVNSPGTYAVIVQQGNCEIRVPVYISSNNTPPALNYSVATQTLTCYTPSVIAQAMGANTSFSWTAPGGIVTPGSSITVNTSTVFSATTIGNYTLTGMNTANACSSSTVIPFYQNTFPPRITIPGNNHSISCSTPSVVLLFSGSSGIPPSVFAPQPVVNVSWLGPAPQASLGASVTYTAATPGVYTVTGRDLNNGCTSSAAYMITDNRNYVILNPSQTFACPTPTVTIYPSVMGSSANLSYSWSVPAGASVTGANSASLTTDTPGSYVVAVSNTFGCVTTAAINVATCTGINTGFISNNNVKLYPNPVSGLLTVTISNPAENNKIEIYNTLGELVKKQAIHTQITDIDLNNEANGIYLVYVSDNNKLISVSKIVKQ